MKVGIPKEIATNETRVAVIPQMISIITKMEHEVLVEKDAGILAGFSDEDYSKNGAKITNTASLYKDSDVILKIQSPIDHPVLKKHESESFKDGAHLITFLSPPTNPEGIKKLQGKNATAFDIFIFFRKLYFFRYCRSVLIWFL